MDGKVIGVTGGSALGEAALLEATGVTAPGGRSFAVHAGGRVNGRGSVGVAHMHGCEPNRRST